MKIIDLDIREMEQARRGGRSRSPGTLELIEAIDTLTSGRARGVPITADQPEKSLRSRLAYVARIAGKRLSIASDREKVMFALSGPPRRRRSARLAPSCVRRLD